MGARTKWLRGPVGEACGFKYRLNEVTPLLIDEVVWDKGIIFKKRPPIEARPESSNSFSSATKQAVWNKTNGHCYYCRNPLKPWETFSIDHVIPKAKGGTDELDNLVPSCRRCNSRKGARLYGR